MRLGKLYSSVEEKELKMLECWLKLSRWKDCARKYTDLILHRYVYMPIKDPRSISIWNISI